MAISAALVVVLGGLAFGTASTALAVGTPRVTVSTSASCSAKNGVATVKITAKGTAKNGAVLNGVSIDVEPGGNTYDSSGVTQAMSIISPASGSYTAVITADGDTNDAVQYATITANGGCRVRVSSTPPPV
jgi:hypothetical protein